MGHLFPPCALLLGSFCTITQVLLCQVGLCLPSLLLDGPRLPPPQDIDPSTCLTTGYYCRPAQLPHPLPPSVLCHAYPIPSYHTLIPSVSIYLPLLLTPLQSHPSSAFPPFCPVLSLPMAFGSMPYTPCRFLDMPFPTFLRIIWILEWNSGWDSGMPF